MLPLCTFSLNWLLSKLQSRGIVRHCSAWLCQQSSQTHNLSVVHASFPTQISGNLFHTFVYLLSCLCYAAWSFIILWKKRLLYLVNFSFLFLIWDPIYSSLKLLLDSKLLWISSQRLSQNTVCCCLECSVCCCLEFCTFLRFLYLDLMGVNISNRYSV